MGKENGSGWEEREGEQARELERAQDGELGSGSWGELWWVDGFGTWKHSLCQLRRQRHSGSLSNRMELLQCNRDKPKTTGRGEEWALVHDALVRSSLDGEVLPLRC